MAPLMRRRAGVTALLCLIGLLVIGVLGAACGGAGRTSTGARSAPKGPPVVSSTSVRAAAVAGPAAARTQASVSAGCTAGSSVLGVGVYADLTTGERPNPSLRVVASAPATGATALGVVAAGGVGQVDARTTAFVVCGRLPAPGPRTIAVSRAAPSAAASSAMATATCPAGTILIGGGGAVDLTDGRPGPPQYFLTGSYPSGAGGSPSQSGSPESWTAVGALGGAPMKGGRIRAFALCVAGVAGSVQVATATALGPSAASSPQAVTVSCPAGALLLAGGGRTGPPDLRRTLQGLHLRGSYPTGPGGSAVEQGAPAASWTVVANSGGMVVLGARTTAYVLCAAGTRG